MRAVVLLALSALLAAPGLSHGDEAAPSPRRHILSAGISVAEGGLGCKYTYRVLESGPTVSAGAGLFGYGLELGYPIHRISSRSRELFLYGGVLRWDSLSELDLGSLSDHEEGSHTWVIGLGPRLWPDRNSRVYVAGAVEWQLSREHDSRLGLALEGGCGF